MDLLPKSEPVETWYDLSKRQSVNYTLPNSPQLKASQKSIERISRTLSSNSLPQSRAQKNSQLTSILHHHVVIAEELEKMDDPNFITNFLYIRALQNYLKSNLEVSPDTSLRITQLEKFYQQNYIPPITKKTKLLTNIELDFQELKNWRSTFPSEQYINLQGQATRSELRAKQYWKEQKIEKAQNNFAIAIENLIDMVKFKLNNNKNYDRALIFKARILLTYFDNTSARKQAFLDVIKNINIDLEPVKISLL